VPGGEEQPRSHPPIVIGLVAAVALLLLTAAVVLVTPPRSRPAQAAADASIGGPVRSDRPYRGLGAWVDMYSWSATFTAGTPRFGLADIDAMAAAGVQTLYIQAASQTGPPTVLEGDRVLGLIQRAHHRGMAVVVWYLPRLVDLTDDMSRLMAISRLPADGVAVDMESTDVAAIEPRNTALIELSQQLRRVLPGRPLGAIVLPATLLEVVNPLYWPDFPYPALAPLYDVWLPMTYWSLRPAASGWRDAYRYTADSVNRLRADLGPTGGKTPVHPIGGVSVDGVDPAASAAFVHAIHDTASVGASVYEWPGTTSALWSALRVLRSPRA
jgi:hypothetical protein